MNQRHGWEDEAISRAVNGQPWEPPPGMLKRQCLECRYWFAADPVIAADAISLTRQPSLNRFHVRRSGFYRG